MGSPWWSGSVCPAVYLEVYPRDSGKCPLLGDDSNGGLTALNRPPQPCSDPGYGRDEEASLGPVACEHGITYQHQNSIFPGILGRTVLGRISGKPCPVGELRGRNCNCFSGGRQHDSSNGWHFRLIPFLPHWAGKYHKTLCFMCFRNWE